MPGGDRTGPLGMGPTTGRALGRCTGYVHPGYMNYAPGGYFTGWGHRGCWGGGRGRGFGWGYPTPYDYHAADETYRITELEEQARYLENSLNAIRKEIAQAKTRKETE